MGDAPQDYQATNPGAASRARVRTPGKHIVLFTLAVTFMIGVSTLMLSRADIALPDRAFAGAEKPIEETFLTDLAPDAQGRLRLIRLTLVIEATDSAARRTLEEKRAHIRERLAFFLRQLSPEDLDGPAAQERLKADLLKRVNLSLAPSQAEQVTIQSIVIQ